MRYAKDNLGMNTTVHAGEFNQTSYEEVRSALIEMDADRIGHGYAAAYADTLALFKIRNTHLEACPASARSHGPKELEAIGIYKRLGMNFGLNTDDPSSFIGNTSMARVEASVADELNFTEGDVRKAYEHAASAVFGRLLPRGAVLV